MTTECEKWEGEKNVIADKKEKEIDGSLTKN